MRRTIGYRSPLRLVGLGPFPLVSMVLVAAAFAFGVYAVGGRGAAEPDGAVAAPVPGQTLHGPAPDAEEFAHQLAGLTTEFAAGDQSRLDKIDCVMASRGHYMCSFALLRPSQPAECHVFQAIWTPMGIDSFKITLSGLASRCGSLREAVRSLQ